MKKTLQFPRQFVENFSLSMGKRLVQFGFDELHKDTTCWVTIQEPEPQDKPDSTNEILDSLNKLPMRFWDLTEPILGFPNHDGTKSDLFPPTEHDALEIVRFLLDNEGKDVITNCAAGISRSAAICKFLESHMGYEWIEGYKKLSVPNNLLYQLLVGEYHAITGTPVEIPFQ